jgi:membrane protein DedA with SNARE-associated domain
VTTKSKSKRVTTKSTHIRTLLLVLAAVRIFIGLIAIPLAPVLYEKHFVVLVLMRPTKEVLLAGGFLLRLGKIDLIPLVAAAIPLAILGVWHFYYLGRAYSDQIKSDKLPGWASRILPPKRIRAMEKLLHKKGLRIVFLGRLAAFPSAVLGAAAGSGKMEPRPFLLADGIGGVLSIAEVIAAGFGLGYAYKRAGPWITVAGVALLAAVAVIVARFLRRE